MTRSGLRSAGTKNDDNVLEVQVHLDSHADCCVFSEHATILSSDLSRTVILTPFKSDLGIVQDLAVSTIAIAYDDPTNFKTFILIFHKSLQVAGMAHHILCPNQLRDNDIQVNDVPLLYIPTAARTESSHSIVAQDLVIPLQLSGVHSIFASRSPTAYELAHPYLFPHITLTADRVWEPHDISFHNNELSIRTSLTYPRYTPYEDRTISEINLQMSQVSRALDDDQFPTLLSISAILTSADLGSLPQKPRRGAPTPLDLAKRWFIGLHSAKRTLERTTQRGVRDFTASQGTRRLRHSTYQLMYRHLRSSVYTDTMFANVKSLQGNRCAQIFTTWFQWVVAYPIPSKSDAHSTLDRLHREYGIFHTIIPDNAKELTAGDFRRKALKAGS